MVENPTERPIQPYVPLRYDDPTTADQPYDSRYPRVAERVAALIHERLPDVVVEHIGSTAIPGCSGKGVVDVMVIYEPGSVTAGRAALTSLGFEEFIGREPFPDDRPVFVGMLEHDGQAFRLHAHLIPRGAPEIEEQRAFRDKLRNDPERVAEYVALKRAVLAAGIEDSADYNRGKEAFILSAIRGALNGQ